MMKKEATVLQFSLGGDAAGFVAMVRPGPGGPGGGRGRDCGNRHLGLRRPAQMSPHGPRNRSVKGSDPVFPSF